MVDVVVVGSGPNGLAAAATMARAGLEVRVLEANDTIGGGARTLDLGLAPGLVHDICSAVHPMAVASPFLAEFDLRARGVRLAVPEASYGQPLDGGRAGIAYRSLERTAEELGADGVAWHRFFAPLVREAELFTELGLGDRRSVPDGLLSAHGLAAVAGLVERLLEQGTPAWNLRFSGDVAPALLTGVAAHAISPMPSLAAAGTSLMLGTLAHSVGWPIPVGGTGSITAALAEDVRAHGGVIETDRRIVDWRELPRARSYLFDTTPATLVQIWGERMQPAVRAGLVRFRYGDAAAKVDFVLSGAVPWADPRLAAAGTVHVGGSRGDMARAEAQVARGVLPERPMVLFSDPVVADPSREVGGLRPAWSYAHVPAGSTADVAEAVTAQIERFAPGFRDLVVVARCVPAAQMQQHNENYVRGDIAAGVVSAWGMVARPRLALDPYAAGIPGVYLCSASTGPGPGVHGMGGWHAARRALAARFGIMRLPALGPTG